MDRRAFLGGLATASAVAATSPASAGQVPEGAAVLALAARLERAYVVPAIGRRYGARLRERLAAGAYDGLPRAELAKRLTEDLQAVNADGHLRVLSTPPAGRAGQSGPPRGPAIQDAGWIAPGTAYIRYSGFPGDEPTRQATAAFMEAHRTARALVIDCRPNGGGGLDEINLILPWLYARPTRLARFEMADAVAKAVGMPFDGDKGVRDVAPGPGVRRQEHWAEPRTDAGALPQAKVYYLTSGRTASAAEHLALVLKRTGRATLIGEATAGANHFGDYEAIGADLWVFLPVGRTVDPDTGADWEGKGIVPDIAVPAARALEEALRLAGVLSVPG